jgi:hypothetical protein
MAGVVIRPRDSEALKYAKFEKDFLRFFLARAMICDISPINMIRTSVSDESRS